MLSQVLFGMHNIEHFDDIFDLDLLDLKLNLYSEFTVSHDPFVDLILIEGLFKKYLHYIVLFHSYIAIERPKNITFQTSRAFEK